MSTKKLSNISLDEFRRFLKNQKLNHVHDKGGHEKWTRNDLNRPIIIQSHIDPIPEFIIKNNLRVLGISKNDFLKILEEL